MITNLMKPILDICERENITIKAKYRADLERICGDVAIAQVKDSQKYIFYAHELGFWEKRLCVAHEAAHHIFGHMEVLKNENTTPAYCEDEARIFSACYIAVAMFFDSFFDEYISKLAEIMIDREK